MKRTGKELPREEPAKRHNLGHGSWVDEPDLPPHLHLDAGAFERLWALHPEQKGRIRIMGKEIDTPRWQQAYEQPYRFSGMDHAAVPLPTALAEHLAWANTLPQLRQYGEDARFNAALVNWYQDGTHYIGPHSDDEAQLVTRNGETLVLSLSFGEQRTLRLKPKSKGEKLDLAMRNNTALLMGGACQRTHKHEVPKVSGKKGTQMGRRINVTFRMFRVK